MFKMKNNIFSSALCTVCCAALLLGFSTAPQAQTDNVPEKTLQEEIDTPKEQENALPEKIVPFKDESPLIAVRQGKATSAIKIATLFLKRADKRPDFRKWAEESPRYQAANALDKKEVFTQEYNRLVQGFREFDEDKNITVKTKIKFGMYSEMQAIQMVDAFTSNTFLRYDAAGDYYAIVPHKIDRFNALYMTPDRRQKMISANAGNYDFTAEVILKVTQIDEKEPLAIEGSDFWLMMADIAELRLWTTSKTDPKLVWRYQADWYEPFDSPELMELFKER